MHSQLCLLIIVKVPKEQQQMIESRVKIINLTNVKKGTRYRHWIDDQHPKIVLLTWYEVLQIIQLYEPTADINQIQIQVKIDQVWQYITNTFSYDLRVTTPTEMQIRYKFFQLPQISPDRRLLIEQELAKCQSSLKQYETKFDINAIDINVFWASPVFSKDSKEGSNKTYPVNWKVCCQGYISEIGKALKKSHKKVYFSTNLLNPDCFTSKNYTILYLLCQTQCFYTRNGRKEYLAGEKSNGELVKIFPYNLKEILKEVSIQLLIFHTSYPYYHLQQIKKYQNIKNILLIRSSPIYHSQSTSYFLNQFFSQILSGVTVKQAHRKTIAELKLRFSKDEMCCCYHDHNVQCQFHPSKCSYMKFTTDHYRQHKIDKKENICCCPVIGQQHYDYEATHKSQLKFVFAKNQQDFQQKSFDFQNGQLQGDAVYLKAFQTRQSLLGNRHILPKLLQIFAKPNNYKKGASYSRILNIYNKMCGEKLFFIENLANFMIRRKIFIENRIDEGKNKQNLYIDKNPDILHTLFCDELTLEQVKKLKQSGGNIIIVSQKQLYIEKVDSSFGSIEIKPLEKKDCMNYIKAQKHLSQILKNKVATFFEKTWAEMFKFVYYPSNFDYNGLMTVISATHYSPDTKKYIEAVRLLKNKDLLEDYILFMILSSEDTISNYSQSLGQFNFYREMSMNISKTDFISLSLKYFHLVLQQFFKEISKFLLNILMCLTKLTFPTKRRGSSLFEATTDCYESVTYTFFKRTIEKCQAYKINEKLDNYFRTIETSHILELTLSFVKNILNCFYLYDVLDFKQEIYNHRVKYRQKQTPQPEKQIMQEFIKQNQQEMQKIKEKDQDRLWQINMQADRKSYALILCLLIINNAIIYRKFDRSVIEIDQQCELDQYFEENLNKYYQRSSISAVSNNGNTQSNGLENESGEGEEPENAQNVDNQDQRDLKVYQQSDFIDNLNYLSRKGLLRLLTKILNKKPPVKIQVVCHSFTLQLILQFYYQHELENENVSIKIFEKTISSLNLAISSFQQYDTCKYRIAYDMMMFLIQVKTWCGRDKINNQIVSEIKKYKCMLKQNRKIELIQDQKSNQTLRIMKQLCKNEDIYKEFKRSIQIYQSFCKMKPKQELYIKGLQECLQLWHELNLCIENIKQQKDTDKAYLSLFNMKILTEKRVADLKYMNNSCVYVEQLLVDLDSVLEQVLKELSERLLVLLVVGNNEQDQKFMVNFDAMLQKNYMNPEENRRSLQRLPSFGEPEPQQCIIRIKMMLSQENIDLLNKRGGCKFLIVNAVNSVQIRRMLRIEQKSSKLGDDRIYQFIAKQLLKLSPEYIFLCLLKDNELMEAMRKWRKKQQTIIRYDCKKLHVKPDDALKSALMITVSLAIANRIKQQTSLDKALSIIFSSLKVLYQYKNNQQEPIVSYQTFNYEQIRLITVLEPFVSIQNLMEERNDHKITIDYSEVIKQQYLQAIKSILNIIPMEPSKKSILHVQKSIDACTFQIFIANLKLYLTEKGSYYHFFQFVDEESHASLSNSQSKQHPVVSNFFEELLGENSKKFLSIHNSSEKMIVVIKNFTFDRKQAWMNEQIKSMFFETERTRLETRYVKIGQVPCLISIRN